MADKAILAYSGGLDTSVAIRWLKDTYGLDVVALMVDIGQQADFDEAKERALTIGAVAAEVVDAKKEFAEEYVVKAIRANALYEGKYPLATALGRPLIAKHLVEAAHRQSARTVVHGCTAKGNDQVRFDVGVRTLDPSLAIIAPMREWKMSREQEIDYAAEHGIPIDVTKKKSYSIDENLWGISIEGQDLEDPWSEPQPGIYRMTADPAAAPDAPEYMEIGFVEGRPVSVDGSEVDLVPLIGRVNEVAGTHGFGRIDMVENRLVGIKSREIYEAPGALTLIQAHMALEAMTMERDLFHYKQSRSALYAQMIYDGQWFSPLRECVDAFMAKSQETVSGVVRVKFYKGSMTVVGRTSENSLYEHSLATYDKGDLFPHDSAAGFIDLWGLPKVEWAKKQRKGEE